MDKLIPIFDALRWIGLSPEYLLATLIGAAFAALIPLAVDEFRAAAKALRNTPNKFDDAAAPILEAIANKLDGGVRDQASLDDLSKLIAKSVWEGAKDPKKAKTVARDLSKDLVRRVVKQIEDSKP